MELDTVIPLLANEGRYIAIVDLCLRKAQFSKAEAQTLSKTHHAQNETEEIEFLYGIIVDMVSALDQVIGSRATHEMSQ